MNTDSTDGLDQASPELRELITRLWPADGAAVRLGTTPTPAGYRPVETYAVVPDARRARFLVPLESRAAAAASLSHYNGLRLPKVRGMRAALALGYRTGLAQSLLSPRLTVVVPAELGREALPGRLLSAHLQQVLGRDRLACGHGVRPLDPNSKPTVQLFSPDGSPVGYAKVGWNPQTRAMTANEAAVGNTVSKLLTGRVQAPAVLHHGPWRDYLITVTAPLPLDVRIQRDFDTLPDLRILLDIAGTAGVRTVRLIETGFWRRLQAEIELLHEDGSEQRLAAALTEVLSGIEARHGATELRVGRWHGDWVPWNIGWHGDRLHVWDWEHSAEDVPIGFDLLHWRFQVNLVWRQRPLADVVALVEAAARHELGGLEVPEPVRGLVAQLYLVEMFVRTYRLKRGGGGWNAAIHPALFEVLGRMAATTRPG